MKITITYAEELRSVVPLSRAILRTIGVKDRARLDDIRRPPRLSLSSWVYVNRDNLLAAIVKVQ